MRTIRAFAAELTPDTNRFELDGPEGHHLLHVLRLKPGEALTLFNGCGFEFEGQIVSTAKKSLVVDIVSATELSREASRAVAIVTAVPKSDRQQFMIEKLVELGVRTWIPVDFRHSALGVETKSLERWQRYVIEASKQCRRNTLMRIQPMPARTIWAQLADPKSLAQVWGQEPVTDPATGGETNSALAMRTFSRWVLDPRGTSPGQAWRSNPTDAIVAVGPEGGFAEDELKQAQSAGWELLSWGDRILRLETAAIAAASNLLGP